MRGLTFAIGSAPGTTASLGGWPAEPRCAPADWTACSRFGHSNSGFGRDCPVVLAIFAAGQRVGPRIVDDLFA